MRKKLAVIGGSLGALAVGGLLMFPPAAHATAKASASATSGSCIVIPLGGFRHISICFS